MVIVPLDDQGDEDDEDDDSDSWEDDDWETPAEGNDTDSKTKAQTKEESFELSEPKSDIPITFPKPTADSNSLLENLDDGIETLLEDCDKSTEALLNRVRSIWHCGRCIRAQVQRTSPSLYENCSYYNRICFIY